MADPPAINLVFLGGVRERRKHPGQSSISKQAAVRRDFVVQLLGVGGADDRAAWRCRKGHRRERRRPFATNQFDDWELGSYLYAIPDTVNCAWCETGSSVPLRSIITFAGASGG